MTPAQLFPLLGSLKPLLAEKKVYQLMSLTYTLQADFAQQSRCYQLGTALELAAACVAALQRGCICTSGGAKS